MEKLFSIIVGALLLAGCSSSQQESPYQVQSVDDIVKTHQFDVSDVTLLGSPFKKAMHKDGEYLQSLDVDRLLAPYLKEADLEPKGKNYGGWEDTGLDGHSLGHYLTAVSLMYASTGKQEYKEIANYVIDELARAQNAIGTGYISGVPGGKETFKEIAAGDINAQPFSLNDKWVPWYNMHKIFAGLRDAYLYAGNEQAKQVLVKLSDWTVSLSDQLTDEQFNEMIIAEYGGMNEVLADVYAFTGDKKYLNVAWRFNDPRVFPPLANKNDSLAGLHANTQIPKIIGAARIYELTGIDSLKTIATYFWDTVVENRTYANGGNSENEHFGEKGTLADRLSKVTSESCNTYNMLKLTEHLMRWYPDEPKYAEYYENALYNHILASQDPKKGMFCYFIPLQSGHFKTYSHPENSFWCCVGSGMENHTKYGKNIYLHTEDELYANLFIPSELNWEEKGVKLSQQTNFPDEPRTTFTIESGRSASFTLKIRKPQWVDEGYAITVNGEPVGMDENAAYATINREWQSGDKVEVALPMNFRLEQLGNDPNTAAIKYGPILLAGKLGTKGMDNEPIPYAGFDGFDGRWDHRRYEDMPTVDAPSLRVKSGDITSWMEPVVDAPLTFKTSGVGVPNDVELAPFYDVDHQRYAVYWKLLEN